MFLVFIKFQGPRKQCWWAFLFIKLEADLLRRSKVAQARFKAGWHSMAKLGILLRQEQAAGIREELPDTEPKIHI